MLSERGRYNRSGIGLPGCCVGQVLDNLLLLCKSTTDVQCKAGSKTVGVRWDNQRRLARGYEDCVMKRNGAA